VRTAFGIAASPHACNAIAMGNDGSA
jgi:hypothetical protein